MTYNLTLSYDLGQASDYPAIVVVERRRDGRLWCRYARKMPLGVEYPVQVQHIKRLLAEQVLARARVVFEATGNLAARDWLRKDLPGVTLTPITWTSGEAASEGYNWSAPKVAMMNNLIQMSERGDFAIPESMSGAKELRHEIRKFKHRISRARNDIFEGEGEHDDLVAACAMAAWYKTRSSGDGWWEAKSREYESIYGHPFEEEPRDPDAPLVASDPAEWWVLRDEDGSSRLVAFDPLSAKATASVAISEPELGENGVTTAVMQTRACLTPIRFDAWTGRPYKVRRDRPDDLGEPEDPMRGLGAA
jgi:hypothetical protein